MTQLTIEQITALIPPQFQGDMTKFVESNSSLQGEYTRSQQALRAAEEAAKADPPPVPPVVPPVPPVPPTEPVVPPVTNPNMLVLPDKTTTDSSSVVDWDDIAIKMRETGDLTEELRKELVDKGVSDAGLTMFVSGQKALMAQEHAAAVAAVGGEENLKGILQYISDNASEERKAELNKALASPMGATVLAGLHAEYQASIKKEGGGAPEASTIAGVTAGSTTIKCDNATDLQALISDERYKTDPSYRALVEQAATAMTAGANSATGISVRRT